MKFMKLKTNCIKLKKHEYKVIRDNLFYELVKQIYDFSVFKP